jgi:cytochrome c oxidase subunit 3/cytochrome o ubiquinol oxidase subunit 3
VAAEHALERGRLAQFKIWWLVTILLGVEFLRQTGIEWYDFIVNKHFTVATNLFGTTFYTLVGLHATHVTVGLVFLLIVMAVTLGGFPIATQARRVRFLSWYWHFVDAIWVVVFTVVYVIGR